MSDYACACCRIGTPEIGLLCHACHSHGGLASGGAPMRPLRYGLKFSNARSEHMAVTKDGAYVDWIDYERLIIMAADLASSAGDAVETADMTEPYKALLRTRIHNILGVLARDLPEMASRYIAK